jgi:hypothetical protein
MFDNPGSFTLSPDIGSSGRFERRPSLRRAGVLFVLLALTGAAAGPLGYWLGQHHLVVEAAMPPLWVVSTAVLAALSICSTARAPQQG